MIGIGDVRQTGELPALDAVLNTSLVSLRLASALKGSNPLRVVTATVVSHTPGKRAVIAYETDDPDGAGPVLIGKAYAEPGRAERARRTLEALSELEQTSAAFAVPRPVALVPEWGMLVQEFVRGRSLDRLVGDERREGVEAAARWLAALHRSSLVLERRLKPASESRKLAAWAELVADQHPPVATLLARLVAQLSSLAGTFAFSTNVPMHKDFHYQHAIFDGERVAVIDLDEVRSGDAAFDVGHFCANLRLLAVRERGSCDGLSQLEAAFLDSYSSATGYREGPGHRFFLGYTCLKVAKQLVRGRGPAPVPVGAELTGQVELMVEEGLRCSAA